MQDLASTWIHKFVAYIREVEPRKRPETWPVLVEHLVAASAAYWVDTAEILRSLPRAQSNVAENYHVAVKELTIQLAEIFDRYFDMPIIPDWLSVLAMFTSLGDTIFADAVRREGHISERRLIEAQKICTTYLSFYLPDGLTVRVAHT